MNKNKKRNEVIARLIVSTRTKKRPVNLIQVAHDIEWLQNDLGSLKAASDLIQISVGMLSRFLSVKRLSPKVQKLIAERKIDSVTTVHSLQIFNEDEQEAIAEEILNNNFNSRDVRILSPLKKSNPHIDIKELVKQIQNSKDTKTYIAFFEVPKSLENICGLQGRFKKIVGAEEIVDFRIINQIGKLELTKTGLNRLRERARSKRLNLRKLIDGIIKTTTQMAKAGKKMEIENGRTYR